jgi:hypothetical protein
MENIQELISELENCNGNYFEASCVYKDVCLKNYKYKPRLNICNQVIHEWEHSYKEQTLTVDTIKQILVHEVFELASEMLNKYLSESQHYEAHNIDHEKFQKKIKKISEICIMSRKGILFKEFIDNYRLGYFN